MHFNCTAVAAALVAALPAFAQPPAATPATGEATFDILIHGQQIGRETASLSRDGSGWIITSTGRVDPPIDLTITRFEMKYSPDWQPLELLIAAIQQKSSIALTTSFTTTTAINEITQQGKTVSKEDQISARAIVLPNNFFASYEALAARLSTSGTGAVLPLYVAPNAEVKLTVNAVAPLTLTGGGATIHARKYDVTIANIGANVPATVLVDDRARLVRFEIATAGLVVVRDDAASVGMRTETARNPTDADVRIQANGFSLAGTVTTPPTAALARHRAHRRLGANGSRRNRRGHSGFRPARRRARERRRGGPSVRQTRRWPERRPDRECDPRGLRRRCDRCGEMAGQAPGRRHAPHRRRGPQRRRRRGAGRRRA
jgi:hypothetical protein